MHLGKVGGIDLLGVCLRCGANDEEEKTAEYWDEQPISCDQYVTCNLKSFNLRRE